jgi:hypothetical protein
MKTETSEVTNRYKRRRCPPQGKKTEVRGHSVGGVGAPGWDHPENLGWRRIWGAGRKGGCLQAGKRGVYIIVDSRKGVVCRGGTGTGRSGE